MNRLRGLLLLLACSPMVVVVSAGSTRAAQTDTDDAIPVVNDQVDGWTGIEFRDRSQPATTFSMILPAPRDGRAKPCANPSEGNCATNAAQEFQAILPRCASATAVNCVSGVGVLDGSNQRQEAVFERVIPTAGLWDFAANPSIDLPQGTTAHVVSIPSAPHNGGDDYLVRVRVDGSRKSAGAFTFEDLEISLYAVELKESPCEGDKCFYSYYFNESQGIWNLNGGYLPTIDGKTDQECVASSEKLPGKNVHICASRRRLPLDKTFYLTVRLSQTPVGWLHGRLDSPRIDIATTSGTTTIDVQGAAVTVPVVKTGRLWAQIPANLQSVYSNRQNGYMWPGSKDYGGSSNSDSPDTLSMPEKRRITYRPSPSGPPGIEELKAWIPVISDTATANVSTWGIRTLEATEMSGVSDCFTKDKTVSGIVTTNATQYSAGPPSLNKTTGSLDYQVAAPHLTSGGAVFKGSYNMVMRSDVARCLYGFSKSPIKAEVSVIEEDGEASAAVTNVSEADGWLKLSASGFTHSAPTVRATITGEYAATKTLKLRTKRTMSLSTLTRSARVSVPKKATTRLTVAASSRRICRVEKSTVRALKKGKCLVTVSVTSNKTTTRTLVTVSVS